MFSAFDAWSLRPNSFAFLAYISKAFGSAVNPRLGGCFVPSWDFAGFVDTGIVQPFVLVERFNYSAPVLPLNDSARRSCSFLSGSV
jgi:hypothetical protein